MIGYIVKVTVQRDRDPSCNTFSLTKSFDVGIDSPKPEKIRQLCIETREAFIASYPTNQGKPNAGSTLLPIDVEIIDLYVAERIATATTVEV